MPDPKPDLPLLYRQMLRSRRFEQLVAELWQAGRISGEMHLGIGEEAVAAGVINLLREQGYTLKPIKEE